MRGQQRLDVRQGFGRLVDDVRDWRMTCHVG
jgi:hypothetical protein